MGKVIWDRGILQLTKLKDFIIIPILLVNKTSKTFDLNIKKNIRILHFLSFFPPDFANFDAETIIVFILIYFTRMIYETLSKIPAN